MEKNQDLTFTAYTSSVFFISFIVRAVIEYNIDAYQRS